MATFRGCIPIKDVQIDFQTEKMTCIFPKGTLEVILMVSSDWDQAKIIEE